MSDVTTTPSLLECACGKTATAHLYEYELQHGRGHRTQGTYR